MNPPPRTPLPFACLAVLAATSAPAAAQVIIITNATASPAVAENFNSYPDGEVPGIMPVPGASIAEDCAGQATIELSNGFEATSGTPGDPPRPVPPPAQDGLVVLSGTLGGLAEGIKNPDTGKGSVTIRYQAPQQTVGLRLTGTNAGTATFQCFANDGSLIDAVTVSSAPNRDITITSSAAPMLVVTFTNTDNLGMAIDNLRHTVPAPASSTLRNAGVNPVSHAAAPPVLGSVWTLSVDLTSTGHGFAQVFGFPAPANVPLAGGQTLLVGGTMAFALPIQPGPIATWSLPLPDHPGLVGLPLHTQGVHVGGVVPFVLSNARDLVFGY